MTDRETERAELDLLRSKWREALLAAREALRAEEGLLTEEELGVHERHLHGEYKSAADELRRFALDEGLPTELAEPFLPLGAPDGRSGCRRRFAPASSSSTTCSSVVRACTAKRGRER